MINIKPLNQKGWTFVVFLGLLLLVFARDPRYLLEPRLWAEEGTVYVQDFLDSGFQASIFHQHLGYYSLVNKLVINLSLYLLPFDSIAHATTYASAFLMIALVSFPLFVESEYWNSWLKKTTIILSSVLLATDEMWLNVINLQFFLGLFVVYLYLTPGSNQALTGGRRLYVFTLLVLAAGTGVVATLMVPFFLYRFWRDKNHDNLYFLSILIAGALLQFVSLSHYLSSATVGHRLALGNAHNLIEAIFWCLRYPGKPDWIPYALMSLCSLVYCVLFSFLWWRGLFSKRILLVMLYMTVMLNLLSLGMYGAPRYFLITSVLHVALLVNLMSPVGRLQKIVLVLFFLIGLKALDFFLENSYYDKGWASFSAELAKVRQSDSTTLRVFPQDTSSHWEIRIDNKKALNHCYFCKE